MQLPGGRGRWAAGAGAVVLAASAVTGWRVATAPPGVHESDQRIAVVDGPHDDQHVSLDTSFFTPDGGGRHPAILLAHGFGGSKTDVTGEARTLARDGYAVLTWSARGFGTSTGQIALDSPDYEVKDVRQLIDWLANRPQVQLDAPGDPRVGIAGQSYGGGIALLTAGYDRRVDAIVPQITWNNLADALFPQGTGAGAATGVFKKLWAGIFFTEASGRGSACGRFLPSLCAMYQQVATGGGPTPEAIRVLTASSPSTVAGRIKAPTLLIQGQSDSLFPLDQADANAREIAATGTPVSMLWYQGGHDGGDAETSRTVGMTRAWFDHYLKGAGGSVPGFTVTRSGGFDSASQTFEIQAATAAHYPGLADDPHRLALATGTRTITNPAGGSPSSISALPGLGALGSLGSLASTAGGALDVRGQSATFDSAKLTAPLQLTGAATVAVSATSTDRTHPITLFAKLYDVPPSGAATPARLIAEPLRLAAGGGTATVTLPAMDHRFAAGHRVRLVIDSTDMGFATSPEPATYQVRVTGPLTVPTDPALRTPTTSVPSWTWWLPVAAAVVAALLLLPRRRRRPAPEAGSAELPLRITGLTKAYASGRLAVDDLSLEVEQGQVLGLLGPNGAGKTTTLRMLMGLIHPDAGRIEIFGQPVLPGAAVLSRLGSFVEGPGFLPHLSGQDNLELYWRATGRSQGDSHLAEALAIADLGSALERPVRTYSQGMRQRLAIAQAMLGLPDLLVLDEPTNGLDPPQIRAMREVLVEYARAGRTVIVSSHLLAEVEQTCTHVVVMSNGRRVAAGPVQEVIGLRHGLEDAFLAIIEENAH